MKLMNWKTFAATAVMASVPFAQAQEVPEGFYIAPMLSFHSFGDEVDNADADFSDEGGLGLAWGYRFASPWSVEMAYNITKSEVKSNGTKTDIDVSYLHLDALYHFETDDKVTPFAVVGVG